MLLNVVLASPPALRVVKYFDCPWAEIHALQPGSEAVIMPRLPLLVHPCLSPAECLMENTSHQVSLMSPINLPFPTQSKLEGVCAISGLGVELLERLRDSADGAYADFLLYGLYQQGASPLARRCLRPWSSAKDIDKEPLLSHLGLEVSRHLYSHFVGTTESYV